MAHSTYSPATPIPESIESVCTRPLNPPFWGTLSLYLG
ncbi:hypothetical protein AM1_5456 [Acaryochloris marina MBIC11017]|uniref:Uncharacterized protein n=1 Tax=Acaryochloris marina (strain MBIC 11017) TaxID=329726 RepID=B0CCX0_ACAM1|nr:hypothetical protein AM1_5456 [Acaryochloris marina MBIC11017]